MNDHFEWFETLRIRKWPIFDHFRDHFEKLRFFSTARSFWMIILKNHFFSCRAFGAIILNDKNLVYFSSALICGCQNYGNNTVLVEFVSKTNWKFGKLHCRNHVCVGLFVKNPFALSKMLFIAFTPPFKQNFTQTYRENLFVLPPAVKYDWEYTVCCFLWTSFSGARSFWTIILKNLPFFCQRDHFARSFWKTSFFFRRAFGAIILCGWSF